MRQAFRCSVAVSWRLAVVPPFAIEVSVEVEDLAEVAGASVDAEADPELSLRSPPSTNELVPSSMQPHCSAYFK